MGYCWRDKKFYSEDELKQKALKSLVGRMMFENKFYWVDKTVDMNDDVQNTYYNCKKMKDVELSMLQLNYIPNNF